MHFLPRHSLLVSALARKARHEERQSYALAAQLASDGHVEGMAAKAEMCLGRTMMNRCCERHRLFLVRNR